MLGHATQQESAEIFPEIRTRFLGVNQTNLLALLNQVGQQSQERPFLHIEVLDVGHASKQDVVYRMLTYPLAVAPIASHQQEA